MSYFLSIFVKLGFVVQILAIIPQFKFNLLKTKHICSIKELSSYRTVNTLNLGYKTNLLMLHKAKFAVCSEILIKPWISFDRHIEILIVKPGKQVK